MNEVLTKTMLRDNIFSVFLVGLALVLIVGTFVLCYSVLKTIYVVDRLADQDIYNKEVIMPQTNSSQNMESLSKPGKIAASQAHSATVEKASISKQTPFSMEQFQPVSKQVANKKEFKIASSTNHNLNNPAENSSTAKISTIKGDTSANYKSARAAELYRQITVNQQQAKKEIGSQTVAKNSNDPVETLADSSINSVTDPNDKDIYARVIRLRLEIERLTERIESGLSDSDYDFYIQLESPVFVIHDRDRLEIYQTELDKMLLDMTHK